MKKTIAPRLETLNDRTLPSTASLTGGVLTITGTNLNDVIVVKTVNNTISIVGTPITVGATTKTSVPKGDVTSIVVNSLAGNDNVNLAAVTVPATIDGGAGNDKLTGGQAADSILGGIGNDIIFGVAGNDTIDGGDGNDVLTGDAGNDSIIGGIGNDTLIGGIGNDTLAGVTGDDNLAGGIGDDSLTGGDGNDRINGNAGNDQLTGDAGNDTIIGDLGNDVLTGGDGNDALDGGLGNDSLSGLAGTDNLLGGEGIDILTGGDGNDFLDGGLANDSVNGEAGNDTILGGLGADNLVGADGNDSLNGGGGDDTINGNLGKDTLIGGIGNDRLSGDDGDDSLDGGIGNDTLNGNNGNDTLTGGIGNDSLRGGIGNDSLNGGAGIDNLSGGLGDDSLDGGAGLDTVNGDTGDDIVAPGDTKGTASSFRTTLLDAQGALSGVAELKTVGTLSSLELQVTGAATLRAFDVFVDVLGDGANLISFGQVIVDAKGNGRLEVQNTTGVPALLDSQSLIRVRPVTPDDTLNITGALFNNALSDKKLVGSIISNLNPNGSLVGYGSYRTGTFSPTISLFGGIPNFQYFLFITVNGVDVQFGTILTDASGNGRSGALNIDFNNFAFASLDGAPLFVTDGASPTKILSGELTLQIDNN